MNADHVKDILLLLVDYYCTKGQSNNFYKIISGKWSSTKGYAPQELPRTYRTCLQYC